LKIWVRFGLEEVRAGSVLADTLDTLRKAIKAQFSQFANCYQDQLIVHTKDADDKLQLLENASLNLDGVLELRDGNYDIYVDRVEAAGFIQHFATVFDEPVAKKAKKDVAKIATTPKLRVSIEDLFPLHAGRSRATSLYVTDYR